MTSVRAKVAVAGAGVYGATIAIRLAEQGHSVDLFDPLRILGAASAINQYRVHSGYHYPRSAETIRETLEARAEFCAAFGPAIVRSGRHYYAIPRQGSRTSPAEYEELMASHGLPLRACEPRWMDFDFIARCYEVDEQIYDPDILRDLLTSRIRTLGVRFHQRAFTPELRLAYDFVIYATYGLGPSRGVFSLAKYQVAEKMLIELPPELRGVALVVVDGPFTAFDPLGSSPRSLFGSAKNTNHWTSTDPQERIPAPYAARLNGSEWERVEFSRFDAMRADAALAVPVARDAVYVGSRFTLRVVEDSPADDRRILRIAEPAPGEIHIFSGKVVSAVKAAQLVCRRIAGHD
ncbi:MAG: FAD-dependent oxidoreductase [Candidatus Acidiferrales bacterium]